VIDGSTDLGFMAHVFDRILARCGTLHAKLHMTAKIQTSVQRQAFFGLMTVSLLRFSSVFSQL
jgi:hypothetical protein